MRTLIDCDACGGPMPAGRACPHCDAAPKATSLRKVLLGLALGAGSTVVLMACYGMAPCDPKTYSDPGYTCSCDSGGTGCLPQCNPATYNALYSVDAGLVCVCSGGSCYPQCPDGGACGGASAPTIDGGVDGGTDGG